VQPAELLRALAEVRASTPTLASDLTPESVLRDARVAGPARPSIQGTP
jgi:hypothetical protein